MLTVIELTDVIRHRIIYANSKKSIFLWAACMSLWAIVLLLMLASHHALWFFALPVFITVMLSLLERFVLVACLLSFVSVISLTFILPYDGVVNAASFLIAQFSIITLSVLYLFSSNYKNKTIFRLISVFAISACSFSATIVAYKPVYTYCDPGDLICNAKAATFE